MKEVTFEQRWGRIGAFTEVKELLAYVKTSDKSTAAQLKILTEHIEKQIENAENNNKRYAEQIAIFGIAEAASLCHLDSLLNCGFSQKLKQRGGIADATPPPLLSSFGNIQVFRKIRTRLQHPGCQQRSA